jgi:hypothetical protein
MKPIPTKVVFDSDNIRPNRVCRHCQEPLNRGDETLVVIGQGATKDDHGHHSKTTLRFYHASCYAAKLKWAGK